MSRGARLVLIGVALGAFGTAVAMLPGGFSPFGPAKSLVLLTGVALITLGFALDPALLAEGARRAIRQRGVWPALGLLGVAALSTATSIDASQSLVGHYPEYRGLLLVLAAAVVGFGAYALAGTEHSWRVLGRVAVVVTFAIVAYALLQFARLDPVPYAREFVVRRVFSTSGNASNLGVVLLMLVPLTLARARTEAGAWRIASWAAFGGGLLVVALSLSRGAWAGAVVGALVWAAIELRSRPKASRWRVLLMVAAGVVAALVLAAALVPNAAGRLGAALDPSSGTVGWRAEVWTASAKMLAERPLLGFGPASFRYAFPPRRTLSMIGGDSANQIADDPHNLLASSAVASGVLALGLLVWLLVEAMVAAWRTGGRGAEKARAARSPLAGPALGAAVAGAVVALQFHFATLDSAPMLAAMIGLALGYVSTAAEPPPAGATDQTAKSRTPATARPQPDVSPRALTVARGFAIALTAVATVTALLAAGLLIADVKVARGFSQAADAATPWQSARDTFAGAARLAPWEPAIPWALGRAATQRVSAGDASAATDASSALDAASARLPLDTLLVAQTAEGYLVVGQATGDRASAERALELAKRAVRDDPENGYRWMLQGIAHAALGDNDAAVQALETAVRLTPGNSRAWNALAGVYTRIGDAAKADAARAKAAAGAGM